MINAEKYIAIFQNLRGKIAKDETSIWVEPASFCLNYYSFNFPQYALFNNFLNICRNKYRKKHSQEISYSAILTREPRNLRFMLKFTPNPFTKINQSRK